MELFNVPKKVALPGLTAESHEKPPGRREAQHTEQDPGIATIASPAPAPMQKPPEKPKGKRFKQLFRFGANSDEAGPSDKQVSRPRLDAATVLETLAVPSTLRGEGGCHALIARSLAAAYNAVRDLSDEPVFGGVNGDGSTTKPPPTPRYSTANFMPSSLSYQRLPLVPRREWPRFLHALLFADEGRARDLTQHGFDRTLDEIWQRSDAGAAKTKASAASSAGPLDLVIDRMWTRIYECSDRWHGKSLPQIASAIYAHCYLGLEQSVSSGRQAASAADVHYWNSLPPALNVGDRAEGHRYDPGEFYYLGDKVASTYRIYIHAKHALAPSVLSKVEEVMKPRDQPWCAKIVSPAEAKVRPDTIVVYVTEPELDGVEALAKILDGAIDIRNRIDSVPPLTAPVAKGISRAWDPECVDRDHSFGSFHAGILAEAFYDVVANIATPTQSALADTARLFLGRYGVDPECPGDRPRKLPDSAPPNMAKFAGEDSGNEAALHELARHSPSRTSPTAAPTKNPRLRVQVMPTSASDVANAKQNLKQNKPAAPNKPHGT